MTLEPPSGSRISVTPDGAHSVIVIPQGSGAPVRYLVGLGSLAWLGAWLFAVGSAVSQLPSVQASPRLAVHIFNWFAGYMLWGAFVAYVAYRAFRPPVPETLRLQPNGVIYDSGIPPLMIKLDVAYLKDIWRSIFPKKRIRAQLDLRTLASLRLRETDDGNRLTVDADASRLELARSASEVEREWLYELLARRYSLPLPPGQ